MNQIANIYQFQVRSIDGQEISLEKYRGQVVLIVNTASECGFTSQYKQLEELYQRFQARGFSVLGFPCNQFGGQEPGSNQEIKSFCETKFGVTFPLFDKIDVNGANASKLFVHLKSAQPGILGTSAIKWNFTKFLIDKNGVVVERYAPTTAPESIAGDIEKLI